MSPTCFARGRFVGVSDRRDVDPRGQAQVQLSADGNTALIQDGRITVWDVPSGKMIFRPQSEKGRRIGHPALSLHLVKELIDEGFDLTVFQELDVDHGFTVPLSVWTPDPGDAWPCPVTIPASASRARACETDGRSAPIRRPSS